MKVQFTFHPERCVGCGSCIMACVNENGIDVDKQNPYRLLKKNEYVDGNHVDIVFFTHGCMHCINHACGKACKKGCFSWDEETATVQLDNRSCVGCHACGKACPYQAIQFIDGKKAAKCNGCISNLKEGRIPACVMACPRKAITIDEKNQVLKAGREQLLKELEEYGRNQDK